MQYLIFMQDRLKIAENLSILYTKKSLRDKAVSKKVLADYVGISQAALSSHFTGKSLPDANHLKKYADYFETTMDDLIANGFDEQEQILSPEKQALKKNLEELEKKLDDAQDFINVLKKTLNNK